ncbi:MAG: protein kinase [Gemmatimonadaceae bacterium]
MTNPPSPPTGTDSVAERVQRALGGAYRIDREIGGGGMSRVFVAHEGSLSRDVVVKVLREDIAEGLSRERFRREVLTSANLQHPNIVGVIAAGDAEGLPYFVMPFVEGESLRARLTSGRALSVPLTVSILRDVARALAFAHERGIVHRDIKPDNVLLAGGAAIVADFGVAKAVASARSRKDHPHGTLTSAGISLGTPAYMAPEQVASDPTTDHRADLYALGVMAYEMLAGQVPFAGRGVRETMQAHLVEAPEALNRLRPTTPAALADLVMRCLEKDPAHRPQDAGAILSVLDDPAVVSGAVSSSSVRALARPARHSSLGWWIGGAAVIVAVVATLVALKGRGGAAAGAATSPAVLDAALPPGVAVLPMVSVSPDSSDAYLALGMSDEITSALSRVPGLRVASRSASAAAQAAGGSTAEVARRLGVPYLLEGTVQRNGDRIRVAVRLVTARDGFSAWSQVYERPTGDLLAVQADIASQIAAAVSSDVNAGAGATLDVTGARDPDAYNDYLRGHYRLTQRTPESLAQAVTSFESAVNRDPAFARAYAELAQAYSILPVASASARADALDKATFAAQRALALDSTSSAAYAALGNIHMLEWRWAEGRSALERAIALDSSNVTAMQWLAMNHLANGDVAAAERWLQQASRRAGGGNSARMLAVAQGIAGNHAAAQETMRVALARDSTSPSARLAMATVLLQAGRAGEAVGVLESIRGDDAESPAVLGSLGYALAKAGRTSEAKSIVAGLERDTRRPGVYPALAKVYLGLGDRDWAIDALTWATAARDDFFAQESMASPLFDLLRSDPRFGRVLGIVGLDARRLATSGVGGARRTG